MDKANAHNYAFPLKSRKLNLHSKSGLRYVDHVST